MTQKPPADAFEIFVNAERFTAAASWLSQLLREHDLKELFLPMQVNAAFALELYLKCLVVLTKRVIPPRRHTLSLLFAQLATPYRAQLIKKFAVLAKDDAELIWMSQQDARYKADLESVLADSNEVFERLRYLHDAGLASPMRACFTLPTKLIRSELMALQPSWEEASKGFMNSSHIPDELKANTALTVRVSPFGMKSKAKPPPSNLT